MLLGRVPDSSGAGGTMNGLLSSTIRGAVGFLSGALAIALAALPEFVMKWPEKQGPPAWTFAVLILGVFLGGATGAVVLTWGAVSPGATIRAALGFGVGFVIAAFCALFSMISLQAGKPEPLWGMIAFGIGFAIGGAIGAAFLSWRFLFAGALCFGLAGAAGGYLFFLNAAHSSAAHGPYSTAAAIGALLIPFVFGGAAFGAAAAVGSET